jgi:hypothetical protein
MGLNARLPDQNPVFIASWKALRQFTDALDTLGGAEAFPTLSEHLPEGDEGFSAPDKAALMLEELKRFNSQQSLLQQAVLVDSERGDDLSMGSNVLGGALTTDRLTGYDLGFDEQGFFVRDRWELNRILFRAMRVEQRLMNAEQHQVEYHDRDDVDKHFVCNTPFGKLTTGEDGQPRMMIRLFHVEIRPAAPHRFNYITDPLARILEEAVAKDLPVEWI